MNLKVHHLTANNIGSLTYFIGGNSTLTLTNSILVNVTNLGNGSASGDYIATNNCPAIAGSAHRGLTPAPTI